jgi:hypothetical protein
MKWKLIALFIAVVLVSVTVYRRVFIPRFNKEAGTATLDCINRICLAL